MIASLRTEGALEGWLEQGKSALVVDGMPRAYLEARQPGLLKSQCVLFWDFFFFLIQRAHEY